MDSRWENQTWQLKGEIKLKPETISNIQISKIYSFQTAYWKKKLSWNGNCYVAISSDMYMSRVWHLPTGHNSLKYNYGIFF